MADAPTPQPSPDSREPESQAPDTSEESHLESQEDIPSPDADVEDFYESAPPDAPDESSAESQEELDASEPTAPTVVARYGLMGFLGEFRHNLKNNLRPGQKVVIRTDRGVELGEVVSLVDRSGAEGADNDSTGRSITPAALDDFLRASSENYPFRRGGRVLRAANSQDLVDFRHLHASALEESKYCREQIHQRNLPMRLVTAEHMLGGERIVFYFTAETRVDFRSLVRNLAGQFRTRIEMRQVGARDEARLVGDYERCGRQCCCREFLKDLKPVSMRMAKVQKATLDPTKISGRCGRLMCCLRYEDECYEELKQHLPRRNSWVRTKAHLGKVVDGQIITQLVRLALYDGTFAVVPVEDILERGLEPPTEEQLRDHAAQQAAAQRAEARKAAEQARLLTPIEPPVEEPSAQNGEKAPPDIAAEKPDGAEEATKKKRRRRRRKKSSSPSADSQAKGPAKSPSKQTRQQSGKKQASSAGGGGEGKSGKKHRGRRRRKKPGSPGGPSSGGPSGAS
ncbi:MAG: hypothetical protein JW849_04960 [Phycisphaerae bacterium]|nr:hypothetical protein [Phycisphaerae bacterium]